MIPTAWRTSSARSLGSGYPIGTDPLGRQVLVPVLHRAVFLLMENVLAASCSSGELHLVARAPSWDEIEAADKREAKALVEGQAAQTSEAK